MGESRSKVLIVDDEPVVCQLLESELGELNYACKTASNGNTTFRALETESFDLVLLDIKLPDMSGMYILGQLMKIYPDMPVIMVTGVIDIDTAVFAMKMGALDYIVKPFDLNKLTASVARTLLDGKSQGTDQVSHRKGSLDNGEKREKEDPAICELNAIYKGVKDRVDHIIGSPKIVTERTVRIARRLQIPENVIRQWREGRQKSILDRKKPAYSPKTNDEQKFVSCAIMNAINLLIDKD